MPLEPTVFVVDDDPGVCKSLTWLIQSERLAVESYKSAAAFLAAYQREKPGCLVLDVRMPGMSGLDLQDKLAAQGCRLPIIMLTGHADVPMCARAFRAGVFEFIEKPANDQVLLDSIQRAILKNADIGARDRRRDHAAARLVLLTPREHNVLDRLIDGKTMKQIAAELGISGQTAAKHRARILAKLEATSDVQLASLVRDSLPPL